MLTPDRWRVVNRNRPDFTREADHQIFEFHHDRDDHGPDPLPSPSEQLLAAVALGAGRREEPRGPETSSRGTGRPSPSHTTGHAGPHPAVRQAVVLSLRQVF